MACPILAGACFRKGHVTQWGGDGKGKSLGRFLEEVLFALKKGHTHQKTLLLPLGIFMTGCEAWVGCRHLDTSERMKSKSECGSNQDSHREAD